jgi:membrane protein
MNAMDRPSATTSNLRRERLQAFTRFLWRRFRDDRCFETAGALSYTTLFAIVPLLAAVFAIFSMFPLFAGWRDHVSEFIFRNFVPEAGTAVQGYLLRFAGNASRLTLAGALVLLVTALMMLASIEDRFNRIWRVSTPRRGGARFLMYWGTLMLGPLLIAVGIGASAWVYAQPLWQGAARHGVFGVSLWGVLPFLITWTGLTLMYKVIPNRFVHWRDAVAGALAAALLFELARKGFVLYVRHVANYREIYGTLAAIPIFLIWVYLSWVIVLLGATFTAALSAFEFRRADELLPRDCEFVGLLRVVQQFVEAQHSGVGLDDAALARRERFLTAGLLQRYLDDLRRAGMIHRTGNGAWVPACDLGDVRIGDLLRAGDYHLPTDTASLQRAAAGLRPELRGALQHAGAALQQNLAVPLRALSVPRSASAHEPSSGETPL